MYALCESSIYALIVKIFIADHLQCSICLDIHTYRVFGTWPRSAIFFLFGYTYKNFLGDVGCLSKWLGSCRIINGCPESGNSDPTGMAALTFLYSMCISGTTILNGNQFIFMIDKKLSI